MGLFKSEEEKTQEMMAKYGLERLTDEHDQKAVEKILSKIVGNRLIAAGTLLGGKAEDVAKIDYLDILMQQNFIIIRQLDKLLHKE